MKIKFNFLYFYCRYLAGGRVLKEYRSFSRSRYSIAKAGLNKSDKLAHSLVSDVDHFYEAIISFREKNEISIDDIVELYVHIINEPNCGQVIRTTQNWVGPSLTEATYIPPKPEYLSSLINDFIYDLNKCRKLSEVTYSNLFELYSRFIIIHPFYDGNGRVARAIWLSMCNKNPDILVPALLYRLVDSSQENHRKAVLSFIEKGKYHFYWDDIALWAEVKKTAVLNAFERFDLSFRKCIPFSIISIECIHIIEFIQNHPFFSLDFLMKNIGVCYGKLISNIELLVSCGFVKKRSDYLVGANFNVYECIAASELHEELERIIFRD